MSVNCTVCDKTVYDQERQSYDNRHWHQACFKCLSCKRRIDVKSVAMIKGDLYCKPCFLKVFKEKGSYASFGVKTLPNWKPGQDDGTAGGTQSPPAGDSLAVPGSEAKASVAESSSTATKPAATSAATTAAPAESNGVNLSSSDLVNPKCKVCTKTVYDQEKQVYDKTVWHIACFKCLSCKRRIDVKAVAMIQGDLYCKPCFLKVFKEKGSYASFGPKTLPKWEGDKTASASASSEPNTPSTPVTPDPVTPVVETPAAETPVVEATPAAETPVS